MTNDYDPLRYGQIRTGDRPAAAIDESPEDYLFSAPRAVAQEPAGRDRGGERDTSWDPPAEADGPGTGQSAAGAPAPAAAPAAPRSVPPKAARALEDRAWMEVASSLGATAQKGASGPGRSLAGATGGAAAAPRAARPVARVEHVSQPALMPRPGRRPVTVVLPATVLGSGGTAALWLWEYAGNPVMAGIAGALGVVVGTMAWFWTRR